MCERQTVVSEWSNSGNSQSSSIEWTNWVRKPFRTKKFARADRHCPKSTCRSSATERLLISHRENFFSTCVANSQSHEQRKKKKTYLDCVWHWARLMRESAKWRWWWWWWAKLIENEDIQLKLKHIWDTWEKELLLVDHPQEMLVTDKQFCLWNTQGYG